MGFRRDHAQDRAQHGAKSTQALERHGGPEPGDHKMQPSKVAVSLFLLIFKHSKEERPAGKERGGRWEGKEKTDGKGKGKEGKQRKEKEMKTPA